MNELLLVSLVLFVLKYILPILDSALEIITYKSANTISDILIETQAKQIEFEKKYNSVEEEVSSISRIGFDYGDICNDDLDEELEELEELEDVED